MDNTTKSILVVGFNTRPLTHSLKKAGYEVYAVDFFGDLDLYPNVRDSLILIKELKSDYSTIKESYSNLLAQFTMKMLKKYSNLDYLIIGSGLDDAYEERKAILTEINKKNYKIKDLNNDIEIIKKARNIEYVYKFLKLNNFNVPYTVQYDKFESLKSEIQYPLIFKKIKSAGGLNVYKIKSYEEITSLINNLGTDKFSSSEWIIQEFIEGLPISCTTISNGYDCEVISINHQIIGERFLNPPKEFFYCGNVVPAVISKEEEKLVSKISLLLTRELGLKGINGFDFVLKNNTPYLLEINPRIPGSISASEMSFELNFLEFQIKSFHSEKWDYIINQLKTKKSHGYTTKLIVFAPNDIEQSEIKKINNLNYVHDKTEPNRVVLKGEPLCTILYRAKSFSESYKGAKKIVVEINKIIRKSN